MNPLALPEVRMHVGRYLTTKDILVCILVCQAWCQDFKPLLYRSLRLDEATLKILPKETIRKHAHMFRHLVMMEPMHINLRTLGPWASLSINKHLLTPEIWTKLSLEISQSPNSIFSVSSIPLPAPVSFNLISLDIHPTILFRKRVHDTIPKYKVSLVGTDQYDIINDDFWCLRATDACIRIIQLNPNLKSLSETWDDMSPFHRIRFMNQFINLKTRIVKLHLSKWELTPSMLNQLIENSPALEYLKFSKMNIIGEPTKTVAVALREDQPPQDCNLTLPMSTINLRQLKIFALTHGTVQAVNLHIDAPGLIVLCVSFSKAYFVKLGGPFSPNSLMSNSSKSSKNLTPNVLWNTPHLEKLICNRTETRLSETSLFDTPSSLKYISMADYEIGSRLISQFVALQGPFLENIRLACFTGVTAQAIKLILTGCPNLVSLYAPEIMMWAGDLVVSRNNDRQNDVDNSSKEWSCKKIERLSVYIGLERETFNTSQGYDFYPFQQHHFLQKSPAFDSGLKSGHAATVESNGEAQHHHHHHPLSPFQSFSQPMLEAQHQNLNTYASEVHECNAALLDQISVLTQLKHLDLSGEHVEYVDHIQIGIPLTLKSGLQKLGSLKRLEHVVVTGWIDDMGLEDIEWMKQSWPNLKTISLLKTHVASMSRLKNMISKVWPEINVRDKDRKNPYSAPLCFYC